MAYSTVPTVVSGDTWSAAQHNTYIRDNFTALWPYTAAGDIAYAASTTALTVLPIGAEGEILSSISGAPAWTTGTASEKYCLIKRTSNQNIAANTQTVITFESETFDNNAYWSAGSPTIINLPSAGYYRMMGSITWQKNSQGQRRVYVGDTAIFVAQQSSISSDTTTVMSFNYIYYAVTDNVNTYMWVWQNTGGSLNIESISYSVTYMGA